MFRPASSFLENIELAEEFRYEVRDMCLWVPADWDPHTKLEFTKVAIRTLLAIYSKKYVNEMNSRLNSYRLELNNIIELKNKLISRSNNLSDLLSLDDIERDLRGVQSKLHIALTDRSKYQRARVNCLEKGDWSNRCFLNIINKNNYRSYYAGLYKENKVISSVDLMNQFSVLKSLLRSWKYKRMI
jgi:hypothetical protein